ncbi:hypothetical protein KCG48_01775 [Proteiniclasticum sp. BAD-10]|uniref:PIN domain-containing protein n=1 Tax=Proteiniclasticum sediminis TaxID=2804028 RepID=A0A941CLW0_9CLOT|nr:hypothetical protein [Proteiniclasticum sediminis]MBR0575060.1 hypothetical protein [Proteiniclasticum sediminis]
MEYVSSDTNVWIDFFVIDRLRLPFRLPYVFIMNHDAIEDEFLSPKGLKDDLKRCGLIGVEITIEEFELADQFGQQYPKLSNYDRIALAIARERKIVLLSGDKALRNAALKEGVSILGTLGVLDQLYEGSYIDGKEYELCLLELQKHNGQLVRLPKDEINSRLGKLK